MSITKPIYGWSPCLLDSTPLSLSCVGTPLATFATGKCEKRKRKIETNPTQFRIACDYQLPRLLLSFGWILFAFLAVLIKIVSKFISVKYFGVF